MGNQYTETKTESYTFSGFGVTISLSWEWKSTTGRSATSQLLPFTWKISSVGKDKVNQWEFCKLKFTTIVVFVIDIQRIFPSQELAPTHSTIVVQGLSIHLFSFIHKSAFLFSKWLLCLYYKQNNRRLLVDMEFFFSCSTRHLSRSLCSLVSYRVKHSKRNSISMRAHVLFSISQSSFLTYFINNIVKEAMSFLSVAKSRLNITSCIWYFHRKITG